MSSITTSTINTQVLVDAINQEVINTLSRDSDFYRLLVMYGAVRPADNDKGIEWSPKISGHSNVQAFADGDPAPAASKADFEQAFLSWGQYQGVLEYSQLAELQLAGNKNGHRISNYLVSQIEDMAEEFTKQIDLGMRGGVTTNGITGVTTAVAATGTYAGLSRSTYPTFASYIKTAGASLTEAMMDDVYLNMRTVKGGRFNCIVGSQSVVSQMKGFGNIQEPIKIAPGEVAVETFGRGSAFKSLVPQFYFMDAPVYALNGWASDRLDFLDMGGTKGPQLQIYQGLNIEPLARVSTMRRLLATMYAQFVIKNPAKCGAAIVSIS